MASGQGGDDGVEAAAGGTADGFANALNQGRVDVGVVGVNSREMVELLAILLESLDESFVVAAREFL